MIHKRYRRDGKPDWARWVMECDSCQRTTHMFSHENPEWLVTANPDMAIFCPACFNAWADHLIASTLRCPECDYTHLRMWVADPGDPPDERHPNFADCDRCGAIVLIAEPPSL
ncbi:hypothetical protein [Actinomadura hibisca]|uniref:hypothetical protein n=1 Tax=Actinomadura hibisca TaxID=68565 RepID=UPI00082F21FB|nr:hypothetical protein [Actinomadura hibisca]